LVIAVGTPSRRGDGYADLSYVYAASVVVGTENDRAKDVMRAIYRPLFINETPILFTSRRTSELIKYAANSFLATKITFINEMADLCEAIGANVQEVAKGIGLDKRIGSKFLHAGPGYGGSCFPKDTLALTRTAEEANVSLSIVSSVVDANEARKRRMANKVIDALGGDLTGKTIAVLGLAFKPNTDDMRDAPSLTIIPRLQDKGAKIQAYDPEAMNEAQELLNDVDYKDGPYPCIDGADALVIITEWDEFRALDLRRVKAALTSPEVIDLRNIYQPEIMQKKGFNYVSVGRPS